MIEKLKNVYEVRVWVVEFERASKDPPKFGSSWAHADSCVASFRERLEPNIDLSIGDR